MKVVAIDISNEQNRKYYNGRHKPYKKEWKALVNDPSNQYDPVEYFHEYGDGKGNCVTLTIGEANTIQEIILQRYYSDKVKYESFSSNFPEDFIPSRIGYEDLKDMADDMKWFINDLLGMI